MQELDKYYQILELNSQATTAEIKKAYRRLAETTVKSEVNTADFYYRLGVEAAENEELNEAVNYFSQAIKIDTNFRDAYFYRGIILEKQGFNLRAESDFDHFKILQTIELTNIWQQVIKHLQSITSQEFAKQHL